MRCCICGKEIEGEGYEPKGALDPNYEPRKWKMNQKCCLACHREYVITGIAYYNSKLKWKSKGVKR